jgi:hypothetical protein
MNEVASPRDHPHWDETGLIRTPMGMLVKFQKNMPMNPMTTRGHPVDHSFRARIIEPVT